MAAASFLSGSSFLMVSKAEATACASDVSAVMPIAWPPFCLISDTMSL
jgi:hypothetical protein